MDGLFTHPSRVVLDMWDDEKAEKKLKHSLHVGTSTPVSPLGAETAPSVSALLSSASLAADDDTKRVPPKHARTHAARSHKCYFYSHHTASVEHNSLTD